MVLVAVANSTTDSDSANARLYESCSFHAAMCVIALVKGLHHKLDLKKQIWTYDVLDNTA